MAIPIPRTDRWTSKHLDEMPENGLRYEVLHGQLVVTPAPSPRHQVMVHTLGRALVEALPDEYELGVGIGVLIGEDEPIPDLIVTSSAIDPDDSGVPAEQVVLAVEVVVEATAVTDRMIKPVVYAEAGVPYFWRCEIHPFKQSLPGELPPVLFTYVLGPEGSYELTHRISVGETATVCTPFEFTLDPAILIPM
ncbi:Uma2 family endonuclease [Nocardia panacis]|uniref:Uma2 family endonuclease n=1 Tax=Nocardia panacis TaxID=2340916 RepID=A0A3A4KPB3_9NOCA|nr:Uma2 family endonuclease [Nocardia panacis]RJO76442.1 Uma2 family endonuclease [Nocardia panacis]